MKSVTQPHIFVPNHQNGVPARLHYPVEADPAPLVSQFPPGFFTYDDIAGCPTFAAHRVTDVVNALHKDWPRVDLSYGRYESEPESSTTVTRPKSARPKEWKSMGPRIRQSLS
ncbi:hypothetical protein [Streptomyces sp. NPDC050804]|uniref:hypothetical protein n=1 Tax=Streptomyces sp. NPDC050804 TaxID=3154745 RepID=UPI00341A4EA2